MDNEKQHGKFGKDKHFALVKKALLHVIDRYWESFGTIRVENETIAMHARFAGTYFGGWAGEYNLHPDIAITLQNNENRIVETEKSEKLIVVECETTANGLLKDELRLTAYKLLRLRTPDKTKLMMYLALPSELKDKIEKPECFNDIWFFDVPNGDERIGG